MRLEEVIASLGIEAGVSEWLAVTQDLIDGFAALTGDRQWIHVDPDRARRESPFGATVAHGFLTVALLSKLVSQAVDVQVDAKVGQALPPANPPVAGQQAKGPAPQLRVNYGFNRLRFPAPVPAGSRIRARVTPNAVRDVEGGIEIAWGVVVEVENQVKPALAAEWLVRTYF
jgi:acyl dehydratase